MHRRSYYRSRSAALINMTPMIDVTFLLLTFFMLASHFASAEKIPVPLPRPDHNQAVDRRFPDKVIINLVEDKGRTDPRIWLGPVPLDSAAELAERLNELGRVNPNVEVILRADRSLAYGVVREVMELISAARLTRVQVVVDLMKS